MRGLVGYLKRKWASLTGKQKFIILAIGVFLLIAVLSNMCGCALKAHPAHTPLIDDLLAYNVIVGDDKGNKRCGGTTIDSLLLAPQDIYILTAAHCIMDNQDKPLPYMYIYDNQENQYQTQIISYERGHDLALLQIIDPVTSQQRDRLPKAWLSSMCLHVGQPIYIVGYGAGVEDVLTKGTISKLNQPNWTGYKSTLLDATAFYGNSGGGVFDAQTHALVGVIIQVGPGGPRDGWVFAVRLQDMQNFLIDLNL